MSEVMEFNTKNAAGGRQFVAHKVMVEGVKHSVWFSDADGGTLVDAERIDRAGRATGIRRSSPRWQVLAKRVPALLASVKGNG